MNISQQIEALQDEIDNAPPAIGGAWCLLQNIDKRISNDDPLAANLMAVVTEDPRYREAIDYMAPRIAQTRRVAHCSKNSAELTMAISSKISLKFDGAQVKRGLAAVKKQFATLNRESGKMLGSMTKAGVKFAAVIGPAAVGVGIAKLGTDALSAASNIESLTNQFKTLLGSEDAAVKRMAELQSFAASTPFEVSELASTSKMLQALGGELLSTGDGLRLVGDAAAMAGEPLSEVGLHVGRLFGALTSGTSAGESVARLQELALISGTAKRQFEALADSQKKGKAKILSNADALNVLGQALRKSSGSMASLAGTTQGKFSNLKDSYQSLLVAFGAPINTALRPMLDELGKKLADLKADAAGAGTAVGEGLTVVRNAVANGDFTELMKSGFVLGATLAGEKLLAAFVLGGDMISRGLKAMLSGMSFAGMKPKFADDGSSPLTWGSAQSLAADAFGSDGARDAFTQIWNRNRTPAPAGYRFAGPDEASKFSDAAGNKLIQSIEKLGSKMDRTNQLLAPQP